MTGKPLDESKWKSFLSKIAWFKTEDTWDQYEAQQTLRWLENSYAKGDAAAYNQLPSLSAAKICPVQLPTRLVDLWPQPRIMNNAGAGVRIVTGKSRHRGNYMTLSHKWGTEHTLKLTTTNKRALAKGIKFKSLPRTYQDAVIVSRSLGFKYLWIDALCIIQDDEQDWLREAAKMASVYHNSSCTISTHAASDDSHGFLHLQHRRGGSVSLLVTGSHLSQRGWVFQERILSRRLLHFTSEGLFLEDASGFKTPDGTTPATDFYDPWKDNKQNLEDSHHDSCGWYRLIERFTACRLTFDTDRLPAVMGLAHLSMQKLEDGDYLWGLWSRSIHQGLLWINADEETEKMVHEPGSAKKAVPSWSWGSWTGRIKFPDILSSFKAECTLVYPETETSNNGGDIAEPVPRAAEQDPPYIMLKLRITRLQNLNFVSRSRMARSFMGVDFHHSMTDKGLDWVSLDGETDKHNVKFDQLALALVAHHHNIETFAMDEDLIEEHRWVHYILLLSPFEGNDESGNKYQRIGVAASTWLVQSCLGKVSTWQLHSPLENIGFKNGLDNSHPVMHPKVREIFKEAELATITIY